MELLATNIKQCFSGIQTFIDHRWLPCRSKFNPRKSRPRRHAPVTSFYLLDYDRRIAEMGIEHEPPAFQIIGQKLIFKKGRWTAQSCNGIFTSSQPDLLKNVREKNRVLQDQNNILQLKLELVMDMLTETTAGLLLMEEEEEETEGKEKEKKEEEEEEEDAEEELEELEMKTCPKKLPKPISAYDLESSDYEYDEELLTSQWRNRYSMPTLSFDDESEYSEEVVYTKRPQDKPKVCPMKRAARAKARSRANIRQSSGARSLLPPKTRSSPKVCKLELEPEPKPKTCPRRKPKPKPKSVRQTDGVCPMKKGSKI
ncbi:hypothetical protein chiPu_0014949 [Chiloscyllium punctatum]|uniref:Uncharacterized protein n=1 Tax=Chiloscyllium punctatum TaxID=137246 RepID=A0A401T1E4_CHIPU|nr:hypothetical protein [Chiloscyllium punctatum]